MSGTSLSQNTPTYLTKATVHPNGYSGTSFSAIIPWVGVLPVGGKNDIVVLTQDESNTIAAGLYVLVPAPLIPGAGTTFAWKMLMSFADICDYSNGATLDIYLNNTSTQTLSGVTLWRNGAKLGTANLVNDPTSVWIAGARAQAGGISNLASASDYQANLVTPLASKLGVPTPYSAATNTPAIASGVAPAANAPSSFTVTDAGVVAMQAAISADIPSARNGDWITWNPATNKWTRAAGDPFSISVSGATTLTDAHNDMTLVCSGTPALTVNTGRMTGFGITLIGAYTLTGSATIGTDMRFSTGNANTMSALVQTAADTYQQFGGKL